MASLKMLLSVIEGVVDARGSLKQEAIQRFSARQNAPVG
jgi:hypothetical protein